MTILDHVDSLRLDEGAERRYGNELNSLTYLAQGLQFLSGQVEQVEAAVRGRLPPEKMVTLFGNAPKLRGAPMGLIACSFHWYAVSACNYIRLVGWLTSGGDEAAAAAYVGRVAPDMLAWRNKVGAHFSRTDPRRGDTPADLAASVMFPVGFGGATFATQPFAYAQTGSTVRQMPWSLTKMHGQLAARHWPAPQP